MPSTVRPGAALVAARRPAGVRPRAARRRAAGVDDREPRRHARRSSTSRSTTARRSERCSRATLVKHHRHRQAFDTVFDVYFSLFSDGVDGEATATATTATRRGRRRPGRAGAAAAPASGDVATRSSPRCSSHALHERWTATQLRRLAAVAVHAVRGHGAGPPGRRHLLPVPHAAAARLRRPRRQRLMERGAQRARASGDEPGRARRPASSTRSTRRRLKELRELIEAEIRRRLVADRGVEAMARTLRKPLPEDVDFMHASREEMQQLQRAIEPLTRALAARLAQRRRRRNRGHARLPPDGPRTRCRTAACPAEPKFKQPAARRSPRSWWWPTSPGRWRASPASRCSSSTRWPSQFSKVRSWVFIDGIDEVTRFFEESDELTEAVHRVNTEADVVWVDGHSDYGHAFEVFHERHLARDHAEDVDHPARRRAQQLPRRRRRGCSTELRKRGPPRSTG